MDLEKHNFSPRALRKWYHARGIDSNRIETSHIRQYETLRILKKIIPTSQWISRDKLTESIVKKSSLLLSVGGDNHFQFLSQFISNGKIVAINSDPLSSEGGAVSFSPPDIPRLMRELEANSLVFDQWSRIQAWQKRKKIGPPALSDIFLGEMQRPFMSRHILKFNGKSEEQKGSGLLAATGTGRGGWFQSAQRFNSIPYLEKTDPAFAFGVTEPYSGRISRIHMFNGVVRGKDELKVYSLNDAQGIMSIDSIRTIDFSMGKEVVLRLGHPLAVGRHW
ncbi:MAG: hypothetical protein AABW68_01750 [archaeon]